MIITFLAEHHGFFHTVFFLGVLLVVVGDGRPEGFPEFMFRCRILLPAFGDDAAVSVTAAFGFNHQVVELVTFSVSGLRRVRLSLQRHRCCPAQFGSADVPVADIQFLFTAVGAEVLAAAAHQQGVVTLVADQRAWIGAAHEGMDAETVVTGIVDAGIVQSAIGFLAHFGSAGGIVGNDDTISLGNRGAQDCFKAGGIVQRVLIGHQFVPGGLHSIVLGKAGFVS